MELRAVIFDLDGTIIDSEKAEYLAWREVFEEEGEELPMAVWSHVVGRIRGAFDPMAHLEELTGRAFDRYAVRLRVRERFRTLLLAEPVRPGVRAFVRSAAAAGVRLAIATSGTAIWAHAMLRELDLAPYFPVVTTVDDVGRAKPDPALFLTTLERLRIPASSAVVVEDSPSGIAAANRAGIFSLLVPSAVTAALPFPPAGWRRKSLSGVRLSDLERRLVAARQTGGDAREGDDV
jgi:HAD superfamily hydrolase (TIGR01509 family)